MFCNTTCKFLKLGWSVNGFISWREVSNVCVCLFCPALDRQLTQSWFVHQSHIIHLWVLAWNCWIQHKLAYSKAKCFSAFLSFLKFPVHIFIGFPKQVHILEVQTSWFNIVKVSSCRKVRQHFRKCLEMEGPVACLFCLDKQRMVTISSYWIQSLAVLEKLCCFLIANLSFTVNKTSDLFASSAVNDPFTKLLYSWDNSSMVPVLASVGECEWQTSGVGLVQ